jgi:hypothetical protein
VAAPAPGKLALAFAAGLALTLLAYLAFAVPGPWFPSAPEHFWTAHDLQLTRGSGTHSDQEWVLQSPEASSVFLLSGNADLRSSDYRVFTWIAVGVPPTADVRLLWRNDYEPGKINNMPIVVESGRLRPVVTTGNANWIGRITGIALAIRSPLVEPVRVRGAIARPMGAVAVIEDRLREWVAFEGWSGTSINTIVGGADVQDFPLTLMVACAVAVGLALFALTRWRTPLRLRSFLAALATLTVLGWLVLDVRWSAVLGRQSIETGKVYGGRDDQGRHLAAEDADLYRLILRTKAVLPAAPQRIFVAAAAHYFRGRAAYHLYPHNVYFDPRSDRLPPASAMHAGDWLFVYQRPGIQYDATQQMLRWEGGQTHAAELKIVGQGGALFHLL